MLQNLWNEADRTASLQSRPPINYSPPVPQSSVQLSKSISHRESYEPYLGVELTDVAISRSSLHRCHNRLWLCEIAQASPAARYHFDDSGRLLIFEAIPR